MADRKTIFSDDRVYRYTLWREWNDLLNPSDKGFVQFIGLNPSTADETVDDPTIRRCIGFSKAWGYGALCMTNLFAFRATDPKVMIRYENPIGPDNDWHILDTAENAGMIVCAWGRHGNHMNRGKNVRDLLCLATDWEKIHCLGVNEDLTPKHPLYLSKATVPTQFEIYEKV